MRRVGSGDGAVCWIAGSSRGFVARLLIGMGMGLALSTARVASAQCVSPHWDANGFRYPGGATGGGVNAFAAFDDGSGPALYIGGNFGTVGGVASPYIAKYDGTNYFALSSGIDNPGVSAMAVFDDDGPGPNRPALTPPGPSQRRAVSQLTASRDGMDRPGRHSPAAS